jgi:hypothetical protein
MSEPKFERRALNQDQAAQVEMDRKVREANTPTAKVKAVVKAVTTGRRR